MKRRGNARIISLTARIHPRKFVFIIARSLAESFDLRVANHARTVSSLHVLESDLLQTPSVRQYCILGYRVLNVIILMELESRGVQETHCLWNRWLECHLDLHEM